MPKVTRNVRRTIQIVCEGYAEECLLKHVRSLYLARAGEVELRIRNARGRGGRGVLDHALSPRVREGFDVMAILIDTDQDWDDIQRKRARAGKIVALESTPCLEAWLLEIRGHRAGGRSAECKRKFARAFGAEAHDAAIYTRHFGKAVVDAARTRVRVLNELLELLGV